MKIFFAKSFFSSLWKIRNRQRWWYKTYDFFRYDIWRFLRNVRRFRKELLNFYPWDYIYNLKLLRRSLQESVKSIEKGHEVDYTRLKKVEAMNRAIALILKFENDSFIEEAEAELGKVVRHDWDFTQEGEWLDKNTPEENDHNSKIYRRAEEIEEKCWKELWEIFKGDGKEGEEYRWKQAKSTVKLPEDSPDYYSALHEESSKHWDGSDMRSWWT